VVVVVNPGIVPGVSPRAVVVVVVVFGVDDTSCEGVIDTSWKTPFATWNTTTIAETLLTVPWAQSG
jgi:hypothetical protein